MEDDETDTAALVDPDLGAAAVVAVSYLQHRAHGIGGNRLLNPFQVRL